MEHHFLFCLCVALLSTGSQPLLFYFLSHPLLVAAWTLTATFTCLRTNTFLLCFKLWHFVSVKKSKIDLHISNILFFKSPPLHMDKSTLKFLKLLFGGRIQVLKQIWVAIHDSKSKHDQCWWVYKYIQNSQKNYYHYCKYQEYRYVYESGVSVCQILFAMDFAEPIYIVEKSKTKAYYRYYDEKHESWLSDISRSQKGVLLELHNCKYNRICQPNQVKYDERYQSVFLSHLHSLILWLLIVNPQ